MIREKTVSARAGNDSESDREFTGAAGDVAAQAARWLVQLAAARRMSPKTCEAYARDLTQFIAFLSGHLGQRVTLAALSRLSAQDVRAYMAARRADGIAGRSLAPSGTRTRSPGASAIASGTR